LVKKFTQDAANQYAHHSLISLLLSANSLHADLLGYSSSTHRLQLNSKDVTAMLPRTCALETRKRPG
jgi:hypothetical protein